MRTLLLTLLLLVLPFAAPAQRAFKPVKAAIKAKNYKEAINQIDQLRKDSLYSNDPKLALYSIEANRGLNDAENMKLYLKQSYDTVAFFSTTHLVIQEAVRLDSIEGRLLQTEARKPKQAAFVSEQLRQYFPNLNAAARFFYKKKNFGEAMGYLRTCLDLPHTPIGQKAGLKAPNEVSNACLYLTAAYNTKNYPEVHRYEKLALRDTLLRATILECLVYTAGEEKDTTAYLQWLERGWKEHPEKPLFFTRLVDYYTAHGTYNEVLRISDAQLKRDTADVSALLAQCIGYLNTQQFDECISAGKRLLQIDTTNPEANYYVGASYVAKALLIQLPENVFSADYHKAHEAQNKLYQLAEPYLERYRVLSPQSQNRWAPLLYKVYLGLNRGKKFAEIEQLL